jgi:hypothetical protein
MIFSKITKSKTNKIHVCTEGMKKDFFQKREQNFSRSLVDFSISLGGIGGRKVSWNLKTK